MPKKQVGKYEGEATGVHRTRRRNRPERALAHGNPFDRSVSNLHRLTLDLKKMLGLGAYVANGSEATRS